MSSVQELEELKKRLGIVQPGKKVDTAKAPDLDEDIDKEPSKAATIPVNINKSQKQSVSDNFDLKTNNVRDQDPFGIGIPLSELIPTSNQLRRRMILESYLMRFVDYDMIVSSSPGTALYEGQEYSLNDLSGTVTEDGENFKVIIDMVSQIITPKGKGLLVKVSIFVGDNKIDETIIGGKNQDEIKAQIKILLERARIKYKQMKG